MIYKGRMIPDLIEKGASVSRWEKRREEILEIMQREVYGFMPIEKPEISVETIFEKSDFSGKALTGKINLTCKIGDVSFSFPVVYAFPVKNETSPVFVHINFRDSVPDRYLPAEEIIDEGFAYAQICYKDVVNDNYNGDFSDGFGKAYYNGRARQPSEMGKIAMWAYSASRTIDWLETRKEVDTAHIMVAGHSRLGKTALWAGATDARIFATFVNDSGAGGSAITRGKTGEHIIDFKKSGLWDWFNENYKNWADREDEMPFDQHFSVALIAPRLVCIGSARNDSWADPESERMSCEIASEIWRLYGKTGLIMDKEPSDDVCFLDGEVGYQIRNGDHFFSRTDWKRYMEFAKIHIGRGE